MQIHAIFIVLFCTHICLLVHEYAYLVSVLQTWLWEDCVCIYDCVHLSAQVIEIAQAYLTLVYKLDPSGIKFYMMCVVFPSLPPLPLPQAICKHNSWMFARKGRKTCSKTHTVLLFIRHHAKVSSVSLWLLGFRTAKRDWGKLWTELGEFREIRKMRKSKIWYRTSRWTGLSGQHDSWEKEREIVTTGWGVRGSKKKILLWQNFKEMRQQVLVLGWSDKKQPLCHLSTWNSTNCLWKSLTRFSFPLIPIHMSSGKLLLPSSTSTVVPVTEVCAIDFSVPSIADSGSQQMQRY